MQPLWMKIRFESRPGRYSSIEHPQESRWRLICTKCRRSRLLGLAVRLLHLSNVDLAGLELRRNHAEQRRHGPVDSIALLLECPRAAIGEGEARLL